jgi:hypothetical protein
MHAAICFATTEKRFAQGGMRTIKPNFMAAHRPLFRLMLLCVPPYTSLVLHSAGWVRLKNG